MKGFGRGVLSAELSSVLVQDALQLRHERRQVFLNGIPDDAQVYAKVFVRQDIAQPRIRRHGS